MPGASVARWIRCPSIHVPFWLLRSIQHDALPFRHGIVVAKLVRQSLRFGAVARDLGLQLGLHLAQPHLG
jgi:hypothetical protein